MRGVTLTPGQKSTLLRLENEEPDTKIIGAQKEAEVHVIFYRKGNGNTMRIRPDGRRSRAAF